MTSFELPDSNSSSLNVSSATVEEAPQQLLIVSVYSVLIVVTAIGNVAMYFVGNLKDHFEFSGAPSSSVAMAFLVSSAPHCFVQLWYFIHPSSMHQLLADDTIFILNSFVYMYACAAPLVYGLFQLRKRHHFTAADTEQSESKSSQFIRPQLSELRSSSMERPLSAKGSVEKRSRLKL